MGLFLRIGRSEGEPAAVKDKPSLQISLLGHEVVLDVFGLTIEEKQTWRRYLADLGQFADEADHMMALATVIIQRSDPDLAWAEAKKRIKARELANLDDPAKIEAKHLRTELCIPILTNTSTLEIHRITNAA